MPDKNSEIVKYFLKKGLIAKSDLISAEETAKHLGCSVIEVLLGKGVIREEDYGQALSKYYKVKFVDLKRIRIAKKVLNLIPETLATEKGIIVF